MVIHEKPVGPSLASQDHELATARRASYVGLVRRHEKQIEVFLLKEEQHDVNGKTIPEHWGFAGGGSRVVTDWLHPRLAKGKRFPLYPGTKLEHSKRAAKREFKQETGRRLGRQKMDIALVVATPDFVQAATKSRDSQNPVRRMQQTMVYALPCEDFTVGKKGEVKSGEWFTLDKAIKEATAGKILDVNVLLGIQAVAEWYMIHIQELFPQEFIPDADKGKDFGWVVSDAFRIYRKDPDDFLNEMREEIERRRREVHSSSALTDSIDLG